MTVLAISSPVLALSRCHHFWRSRPNRSPVASHRPFGSTASSGPAPAAFHTFFPPGTSQAVSPVFSDVLYTTFPSELNPTRCTGSPHRASELFPRYMSRTTFPVVGSNRRTSCEVRPPASHLPSADSARSLIPPRWDFWSCLTRLPV